MPELSSFPTWRRRLRISVRGLMALVLIVGGGLGWLIHRARVQRDAVAAIKRAGGYVQYDWQRSRGIGLPPPPRPPGPAWLRRQLGPDFLDTVTAVTLHGETCDDDSLRAACRLPWLEELTVLNTSVTDASAEHIRALTNLRSLDLRLNPITGRTLRSLGTLRALRILTLSLKGFPVKARGEDLAFLSRLPRLERLNLYSADLDDAWLAHLEGAANLKSLHLTNTSVTAEGLDHLTGLSRLNAVLSLHGTEFRLMRPNMTNAELAERGEMLRRIRVIRGK